MLRFSALAAMLLLIDLFYVCVFRFKFGKALPLSFITATFTMFFCSLLGKLSYFKYAFALYALISLATVFLYVKKGKRTIQEISFLFLRPSTAVLLAFFLYFYMVCRNNALSQIDDFVRWAGKVRDAINNDILYTDRKLMYNPADVYPPFSTLLEVLFNKFLGGYNESWSLFGIGTFCFSLLLPFLDRFEWTVKGIIQSMLTVLTILACLLTVGYDHELTWTPFVFNCTYVDWTTAALLGYGFYLIFNFDEKNTGDWYSFALLNAALMLTDRISLVFTLLLVVTLFIVLRTERPFDKKTSLRYAVFALVIPVGMYLIWRGYVIRFNDYLKTHFINNTSTGIVEASVSFRRPHQALTEFQTGVLKNFIYSVFTFPIYYHPFRISFAGMVGLISLGLFITYHFHKEDGRIKTIAIMYILGALGHLFTLSIAYMFKFTAYEAEHLAAFQRYGVAYTLPGIILLLGVLIHYRRDSLRDLLIIFAATCLFVEPVSIETLAIKEEGTYYRYGEKEQINYYLDHQYNGEKTLVINQIDLTCGHMIRYLYGVKGKGKVKTLKVEDYGDLEWFKSYLNEFDYLLISDYNDYFLEEYWQKITDIECWNMTLYRINHIDKETYTIELVYPWSAWMNQ